jgi:hypothetical protein
MDISANVLKEKLIQEFDDWLILYSREEVDVLNLPEETKYMLSFLGLPCGAAPEFQFEEVIKPYSSDYYCIGEGRKYKKIVISNKNGEILQVEDNRKILIANSLDSFLYILVLFAEMVGKGIAENGKKAYLTNHIPAHVVVKFKNKISLLGFNSEFWENEIERLKKV